MSSKYFQSLTQYLHSKDLLSDDLKKELLEHDKEFNNKPSVKLGFGKYKGKTISEISEFDEKYLSWLCRQSWCFEDVKEEIQNKDLT